MYEKILLTDTALQTAALFGNFDRNIAAVEKAFGVSVVNRDTEKTAGDAVVIRGEDSFVRAQLAGTPLLWATYPTEDKAHEIKLDAWLARFREAWPADAAVPFETYEAASRHWVDGTLEPAEVKAWLDQLPVQKRAAEVWRESLLRRGDLARRILELVPRA